MYFSKNLQDMIFGWFYLKDMLNVWSDKYIYPDWPLHDMRFYWNITEYPINMLAFNLFLNLQMESVEERTQGSIVMQSQKDHICIALIFSY